ncbi:hypothetical protein EV127DRAFT_413611 [Xylaria flabelliformis]|nr:hypothetical protein EV127DRAFT_413611 [Xylaria flabelliformis]
MDDNAQPPAPDVPRPPPREANQLGLVLVIVFGILLGQLYLSYIVPKVSVLPTNYLQADFQNKSANYYDVLKISHDANALEIEMAFKTQISNLSPMRHSSYSVLNLTVHAKIIEVERAFSVLQGKSRCLYDFEFLGLGTSRLFRCWWNTVKLYIQNQNR